LSISQFAGDMGRAFEVMRRGEQEKTVIIPIPGQVPPSPRTPRAEKEDEAPKRYTINDPSPAPPAFPEPPAKPDHPDSIPIE